MKAQTFDTCAAPGCKVPLRDSNVTGVCRNHMHSEHCACLHCLGEAKPKLRVRTRSEMVALGLLPPEPVFQIHARNM